MTDFKDRVWGALFGAGDDDDERPRIEIVTPQFHRLDGIDPEEWVPDGEGDIEWLRQSDEKTLKRLGLRPWDGELWLFPAEWFDHIPEGTEVRDILGDEFRFDPEKQSRDRRFGCVAFGIVPYDSDDGGGDGGGE